MTAWALDERGRLSGRITFDNLADVRTAGEALIAGAPGGGVEFDCSGLEETSSLTVALLIAWQRAAGARDKSVAFKGTSRALRRIAAFSGLNDLLTLAAVNTGR